MNPSVSYAFLIPLAVACFALLPQARATCQDACLTSANTVQGDDALISLTTGIDNTAIGFSALSSNTTGSINTATGAGALSINTTGAENTATGWGALTDNTTGSLNTATGGQALSANTTGSSNTATGEAALNANTIGNNNTASGFFALAANTSGNENTANGVSTLRFNTIGVRNTATGLSALAANTSGSQNTADAANALFRNTTGIGNVAIGYNALFNNTTGGSNTAVGLAAGSKLTTGSNNIDIGNTGVVGEGNTIRIGTTGTNTSTYIAGISGVTVAGGVGVIIDSSGHLGTVVSSARFKTDIKPMDKTSETILSLQPVTFRYKHDLDPAGIPQFGLVAEEVERVNPDLVARDEQGKPYTVRYEAVNAMLLNEFLKEHTKVEEQDCKLQEQGATIARLEKQVDMLSAGLQKVRTRLELVRPPSQKLAGNR